MIHAKDLRFGNKVRTRDGETITVHQLLGNSLIYDTQIRVNREVAAVRGSLRTAYAIQYVEVIKEADYGELEPIVLTPKLLEKCGFRNFVREEWILRVGSAHVDFMFSEEGLKLRQSTPGLSRSNIIISCRTSCLRSWGMSWFLTCSDRSMSRSDLR